MRLFKLVNGSWNLINQISFEDESQNLQLDTFSLSADGSVVSLVGNYKENGIYYGKIISYTIHDHINIDENSKVVKTFSAIDLDESDTKTWSITGEDADLFIINSNTGVLEFKNYSDFENPKGGESNNSNSYSINVIVEDSSGKTDIQKVNIKVQNLQEIFTEISGPEIAIDENQTTIANMNLQVIIAMLFGT